METEKKENKLIHFLLNIDEILGYITLTAVVFFTALNVVLRYCFHFTISFAEEITLIAFIWSAYLGSAAAYKCEEHIAIDIIINLLPEKARKWVDIAINVFIIIISASYLYLGIVLCRNVGSKSTTVMSIPYIWVDLCIVVSFGLMTLYGVIKLIRRIQGKSPVLHSTGIEDVMEEAKNS
ncbi:TRAP transporter small permease [Clostridium sp. AM58-1XD]|uniref:TRAP transporter small permease n=1 Tax=Clostridium sp. AM58-1XD TaxID=2292307 RepID=UPI000E4F5C7A|nr:TRAP transporter small permease [Clostridium sp. AM58-1XD]RGY94935.1 TRAP transporter small permease [Clostridium sp. AM58-1XD]